MINLLLGAPGGGKGYEACVFHILVALEKGRKVITNMPLDLDRWRDLDPAYPPLLEVRSKAVPKGGTWEPLNEAGAFVPGGHLDDEEQHEPTGFAASGFISRRFLPPPRRPRIAGRAFAGVWCYHSTWRHPKTGQGPLYVIDEAHLCLPKIGSDPEVLEWFSLHRHFNADVLLITQSYGKIAQDVRDLVQVVYRVRKNVALGSTGSYTRKVQDGLRGEVVGQTVRKYDKRYFGLWKSHTQGIAASEANASDVRPIWKHWSFIGAFLFLGGFAIHAVTGGFRPPWEAPPPKGSPSEPVTGSPREPVAHSSIEPVAHSPYEPVAGSLPAPSLEAGSAPSASTSSDDLPDPFAAHGLHLVGVLEAARGPARYLLVVSQSGQAVATITDADLRRAGYTFESRGRCVAFARWPGASPRAIVCDAPTVEGSIPGAAAVPGAT